MRTRIAPTPSGFLHQGNVFNFLLTWLWARANKGTVLLRIDDLDAQRKRAAYVEDIFRVAEWLGIDWDEGPSGPDDLDRNWSQVHRMDLYHAMLVELIQKDLLYACSCSRSMQTNRRPYSCDCYLEPLKDSAPGKALRIKMKEPVIRVPDIKAGMIETDTQGSFSVRTKEGFPAYQLACVADDRHFGITHICRGFDLLPSSAMQLYLSKQLQQPWMQKVVFWHHALLENADGTKLSKSAGMNSQSLLEQFTRKELLASFSKRLTGNDKGIHDIRELLSWEGLIAAT